MHTQIHTQIWSFVNLGGAQLPNLLDLRRGSFSAFDVDLAYVRKSVYCRRVAVS
jgi:hypothetical protein